MINKNLFMQTSVKTPTQTEDELFGGAETAAAVSSGLGLLLRNAGATAGTGARSNLVNRTHRVVQERARMVAARRSKIRSLWVPFVIFSSLLTGISVAIWNVLDDYDLVVSGTQTTNYEVLVPLFWSIPVSAALLAVVWFRQTRGTGRRPVE